MPKDSFYESLYAGGKPKGEKPTDETTKPFPESHEEAEEHLAELPKTEDEALVSPWTHRFTVYCKNPPKDFVKGLKGSDCVVAVFEKLKNRNK